MLEKECNMQNPPHVVRYDDKRTFAVIIKHVEAHTMGIIKHFFALAVSFSIYYSHSQGENVRMKILLCAVN